MMTTEQFLLCKLAEEAAEIAQMALKCQQYGLEEVMVGQPLTNSERLHGELNDMFASIRMLNDECEFEFESDYTAIQAKIKKVQKYAEYSRSLNKIE